MKTALRRLRATSSYRELLGSWRQGGDLLWGGLWGSSKALLTASLSKDLGVPSLVVVPGVHALALALDDLATFGLGAVPFPAREARMGVEAEVLRERFHAFELLRREGFRGTLVAPLAALLQPPPPEDGPQLLELHQGMRLSAEGLLQRLVRAGLSRVPAISAPGELALRGDILDFFLPALGEPLRLEFFDEELESVRVFDLATQRTRHVLKHLRVPLSSELPEVAEPGDPLPLERMPAEMRVYLWEPARIQETAARLKLRGGSWCHALARTEGSWRERSLGMATLPGRDGGLDVLSVEEYCRGVADGAALLAERAADGERVLLHCATEAERSRLKQILADRGLPEKGLELPLGGLEIGFRIPEARLTVLHHRELVPGHGAHRPRPRHRREHRSTRLESLRSLSPGDLVVHAVHGLARFRTLDAGPPQADGTPGGDVIVLEFADQALLQVPASRVDLVERYIGAGGGAPALDRLGSGAFARRRGRVEHAVEDLAAEMLEIQAQRMSRPGTAFPPIPEQAEFDASFPWEDTPDQAQGAREILDDLAQPVPMDRLLCGDVGYGKTELAARAAFRVIFHGYQAAFLVPTTVLAEQHLRTLRQRFAGWPVRVEQLSRIVPPARRREVLAGLEDGSVDLVIGTHRLLSRDVSFRRLGLLVVDEEQRFGVKAKEALKRRRAGVDVLSLSATPIPRTLHMAMAGIRDISSLSPAPAGRIEIHTELRHADDEEWITAALRRELERGGQAFFVHNRVHDLDAVAARLRRLVPEARVVTGHGQMEPRELERAMLSFVRGEANVLCCTTIVESGLDIPTANTMFIDDAHRYGLADLHQLRGRVGRSSLRGYCYLLIPRGQPLPRDARRRIKAVEELRYLGAGFQIAIRDLEIRGAGNLLGAEQSGHIAAVGYETYRRLLAQAVQRLRRRRQASEPSLPQCHAADIHLGVEAGLPPEYVPDEASRLDLLRAFDRVRSPQDVEGALEGLRDRFGPPPPEVGRLARIFFLKHRLGALGLDAIQHVDDRLICTVREMRRFERALRPQGIELRVITARRAHWILPDPGASPEAILDHLYATARACRSGGGSGESRARRSRGPRR